MLTAMSARSAGWLAATLAPAVVVFCVVAAVPASAQLGGIITGDDVDRVVELANRYGPAERQADSDEDGPWIRAEMDGIIYTISFLNCTDAMQCRSVQFRAWWESRGTHSITAMNRWNRERRFSKAYLDLNDNATVEFDVNLTGGITAVNFDDTLQWWQVVLQEFAAEVIETAGGEPDAPPGGPIGDADPAMEAPSVAPDGLPDAVKRSQVGKSSKAAMPVSPGRPEARG